DPQHIVVTLETVAKDHVVARSGIACPGIAPVTGLDPVPPEPDRGGVAVEAVAHDPHLLAVLDRDRLVVVTEVVGYELCLPGVAAPSAVPVLLDAIGHEHVAGEGGLDP